MSEDFPETEPWPHDLTVGQRAARRKELRELVVAEERRLSRDLLSVARLLRVVRKRRKYIRHQRKRLENLE